MTATIVEPPFTGEGRQAVVDGLLAAYERLDDGPIWVSLEAPAGIGKTRIARKFYGALCAAQAVPEYWPESIVGSHDDVGDLSARRKIVNPRVIHQRGSLPECMWWAISASVRNNVASVALSEDLEILRAHAAYLDDAWRARARAAWLTPFLHDLGLATIDEAGSEVKS